MTERNSDTIAAGQTQIADLWIAVAAADRKSPDDNGWGRFKADSGAKNHGINIMELGSNGKVQKPNYLVRIAPVLSTAGGATLAAASKPFRVGASSLLVAPKLKVDLRKEIIKPRTNMIVDIFSPDTVIDRANADHAALIKAGIPLATATTEWYGKPASAWFVATAKKPASTRQIMEIAPRAEARSTELTVTNGKINWGGIRYQAFNAANGKWSGVKLQAPTSVGAGTPVTNVRVQAVAAGKSSPGVGPGIAGTITHMWGQTSATNTKPRLESAKLEYPGTPTITWGGVTEIVYQQEWEHFDKDGDSAEFTVTVAQTDGGSAIAFVDADVINEHLTIAAPTGYTVTYERTSATVITFSIDIDEEADVPVGRGSITVTLDDDIFVTTGLLPLKSSASHSITAGSVLEYPEAAFASKVVIAGTKDEAIVPVEIEIVLSNDSFVAITVTEGVAAWFEDLPAGLTATLKAAVADGDVSLIIVIAGTPTGVSENDVQVAIPAEFLNVYTGGADGDEDLEVDALESSYLIEEAEEIEP